MLNKVRKKGRKSQIRTFLGNKDSDIFSKTKHCTIRTNLRYKDGMIALVILQGRTRLSRHLINLVR